MTGRDPAASSSCPNEGMKNEVVLQKGHEITYGDNVSQNVRMAGASLIEIGAATQCGVYQLRDAISRRRRLRCTSSRC